MTEIVKKEMISMSEVKETLEKRKPDEMDQIQRWTFDYVTKFSKISQDAAKRLVNDLIKECEFTEEESVELVNIMPKSLEELRTFTFGWKKLILTSTLEKALTKLTSATG
ncbi:MAG: RNA polymerase Rpb4 [Thermoproteota archaeon]|nr:RNA polymerase Rpb4 [Thermoproteota archaeon]